jgi:hypothetical protein
MANLAAQAFQNLANGVAMHEQTYATAIPGFRFVPYQTNQNSVPLIGVVMPAKGTFKFARRVVGNKGLYLYYSTSNGVETKQTDNSGSSSFAPSPEIGASGTGGNTDPEGSIVAMTITNLESRPIYVVFAAFTQGDAATANRSQVVPTIRNIGQKASQVLRSQGTGRLAVNATTLRADYLQPSGQLLFPVVDASGSGQRVIGTGTGSGASYVMNITTADGDLMMRTPDNAPQVQLDADNGPKNARATLTNYGNAVSPSFLILLKR